MSRSARSWANKLKKGFFLGLGLALHLGGCKVTHPGQGEPTSYIPRFQATNSRKFTVLGNPQLLVGRVFYVPPLLNANGQIASRSSKSRSFIKLA
jgi:hypothetical protein